MSLQCIALSSLIIASFYIASKGTGAGVGADVDLQVGRVSSDVAACGRGTSVYSPSAHVLLSVVLHVALQQTCPVNPIDARGAQDEREKGKETLPSGRGICTT